LATKQHKKKPLNPTIYELLIEFNLMFVGVPGRYSYLVKRLFSSYYKLTLFEVTLQVTYFYKPLSTRSILRIFCLKCNKLSQNIFSTILIGFKQFLPPKNKMMGSNRIFMLDNSKNTLLSNKQLIYPLSN